MLSRKGTRPRGTGKRTKKVANERVVLEESNRLIIEYETDAMRSTTNYCNGTLYADFPMMVSVNSLYMTLVKLITLLFFRVLIGRVLLNSMVICKNFAYASTSRSYFPTIELYHMYVLEFIYQN